MFCIEIEKIILMKDIFCQSSQKGYYWTDWTRVGTLYAQKILIRHNVIHKTSSDSYTMVEPLTRY